MALDLLQIQHNGTPPAKSQMKIISKLESHPKSMKFEGKIRTISDT